MREKSTQSDGYLNSQAEEKLQESDLVLEVSELMRSLSKMQPRLETRNIVQFFS